MEFKKVRSHNFDFAPGDIVRTAVQNGDYQLVQYVHVHCAQLGEPFTVRPNLIPLALKLGHLEIVSFLLDHHDDYQKMEIEKIAPSIQSRELIQRLISHPYIRFDATRSRECLILAGNFELFQFLDDNLQQHQQLYNFRYEDILNCIGNSSSFLQPPLHRWFAPFF
ncbi:hypothetical protein SAMD00019534_089350 [Acytostelium subglobosum LB1]|uniref:hypothetical protein n=1 Tax=Acytostelium subglobosum LB1 TaxID=1410327 RepID=UPI0006447E24|nr:hypothetical protein SAMD00019534_089350 [Acytostelium subglobosum LB1]GAM25760.1 hypothetical protein SAMD00019534_089350 [Acytostelium subglobosum LB1]|eukprot:XP_012751278.1 hypothetical protein SAMD00019534_089350 [Acytostelium subglobosum LB1]